MADRGLPHVPSELVEPHIVKMLGNTVQELGLMPRCPRVAWFQERAAMFRGVRWLTNYMECVHAHLAMGNAFRDWEKAAEPGARAYRLRMWTRARQAVRGGE